MLPRALALLLVVSATSVCRPADDSRRNGDKVAPRTRPDTAVTNDRSQTPESLRLELAVPNRARVGEPVPIALRVINVGERPIDLYLQGRTIVFDIVVEGAAGDVVWRRLAGQTTQAILRLEVLAPGDTLELRDTWNQRTNRGVVVGPGTYTLRGLLPTDARPLETPPASLRIEPR